MKTNTKTMRTIMFLSLSIAMVLIPANTATANEFMQNRKEYETALNHTVTLTSAADHCQGAVDGGGIVDLNYGNGHVYAQHNNTGGAWINNLQAGQTFTMNGSTYRVNGQSVQGAQYAPGSGDWMQTCNGNGNHLVGITKIS